MQEELLETIRNPFFLIYLGSFLSFCVVGSTQLTDTVQLEFQAYRLQQLEVNGNVLGSRSTRVAYEAVALDGHALRRCTVVDWQSLLGRDLDELLSSTVGALLIVIPQDLDTLGDAQVKALSELEQALLAARTDLAVYVTPANERTNAVLSDVAVTGSKAPSATQQLVAAVASNSFHFSSTTNPPTTPLNYPITNVVARLSSGDRSAPTMAFVAHYDSHSAFPGLSSGADSNGSGVVALLELLAILKKFYDKPSTRPPYNLVFVWTAAGKHNFQGARQWVDEWNERNVESRLELAICLEALAGPGDLKMHVGKAPADGSSAAKLLSRLRSTQSVEVVAKKINLNQPLAWEHERFNMKRLPAVTLSRLPSHESAERRSLLDTPRRMDKNQLHSAVRSLAESVLGYVLNLSAEAGKDPRVEADNSMLSKEAVDMGRIEFFCSQFCSSPRSVADADATKSVAANIASTAQAYAKVSHSPVSLVEVSVWGGVAEKLLAERVKPAVFELVIAAAVVAYLTVFHQFIGRAQTALEGTVRAMRKSTC